MAEHTIPISRAVAGFNGWLAVAKVPACAGGVRPAPKWKRVGEVRDVTITIDQETIDANTYDTVGWGAKIPGFKTWEASIEALYLENAAKGALPNDEYKEGQMIILSNLLGDPLPVMDTINVACSSAPEVTPGCPTQGPLWFKFVPNRCEESSLQPWPHFQYIGVGTLNNWELNTPVDDAISISVSIEGNGGMYIQLIQAKPQPEPEPED